MSQVNLNHVITGREIEEFCITDLSLLELSESVGNMTDRATALANLLLPYYECMSQREPDSRTVHFALNSISIELMNIQKTVEAYAVANKPYKT